MNIIEFRFVNPFTVMYVSDSNLYHLGLGSIQVPVRIFLRPQFVDLFASDNARLMRQLLNDINQRLPRIAARSDLQASTSSKPLLILVKCRSISHSFYIKYNIFSLSQLNFLGVFIGSGRRFWTVINSGCWLDFIRRNQHIDYRSELHYFYLWWWI